MLPPPRAYQDLSHVECFQLQRAFLHFEVLCTTMQSAGSAADPSSTEESVERISDRLHNILQPWETEELVCILDYLATRLEDIFDKLETDRLERITDQLLTGTVHCETPFANDSNGKPAEISSSGPSISLLGA
jgi:hypothetical protein